MAGGSPLDMQREERWPSLIPVDPNAPPASQPSLTVNHNAHVEDDDYSDTEGML